MNAPPSLPTGMVRTARALRDLSTRHPARHQNAGLACMWFLLVHVSVIAAPVPVRIDANPGAGFHWPYYFYVPASAGSSTTLLVEPNNTGHGDDDFAVHDVGAQSTAWSHMSFAAGLGCPLIVPVFPRPSTNWQLYTHALDRDTLLTSEPGLQRIDLQLIAMIDDARARLSTQGKSAGPKVFMMGFSASGMFTNRFTLLHPDRVQAAAIGSPGGWPLAPVASWQGQTLRYNIGIADVATITGTAPDLATYVNVPQYFYIGDQDTNDSVPSTDGYDPADTVLVDSLFGTTPVARWSKAQEIYQSIGARAAFVMYPGVGHNQTPGILSDIQRFFFPGRMFSSPHIKAEVIPSLGAGKLRVEWATLPGLVYQLQSSTDLTNWTQQGLPSLPGDELVQIFETATTASPGGTFFRVAPIFTPAAGTQGRFFAIILNGAQLTFSCTGLSSGTFTVSDGSAGSFTMSGQPLHAVFTITTAGQIVPTPGVLTGDFSGTSGSVAAEFTPAGGSAIPFAGTFELLTVP